TDQHPTVQRAQAALDKAELDLSYAVVKAPENGIVTKVEQVQPGSYVTASTPVFSMMSDRIWVEANFKETELTHMRQGQDATVVQGVDTTITNVALPHMQGSLSASQDQIAWVVTSYIVAAAIMTPLTGWLAGRFGIKYVFLFSVAGFTIASALCGAAQSLAELVIFRLLQGVCGAALVPLSQAVLFQINPPERHAKAMAVWGMGVILGPIIGPALGGYLTDYYNWRWVFYINLPVGVLAALGIFLFIRETRHGHRERFDFFGFASLSLAIGALQMLLDRGELKDWFGSTEIWIEAVIAALG